MKNGWIKPITKQKKGKEGVTLNSLIQSLSIYKKGKAELFFLQTSRKDKTELIALPRKLKLRIKR